MSIPVLLTTRELDIGGIARDVTNIAIHLDRSRFEPHVACFRASGMRHEELCAAGIPLLHLPIDSLCSTSAVTSAFRLRRYIRDRGIVLLHSYDPSSVFAVPITRMMGLPAIIGSQLTHRTLLDKRTRQLLRMQDRIADTIIVNCEALRRHMVEQEHVPPTRIEVCSGGVDTTTFCPADSPKPEVIRKASLVVGTVCALRPEKGVRVLQEAFAKLGPIRDCMTLVIVGSGPELPNLEANAARLQISGSSVFVPATPAVAAWMQAMDIFVLPSYSEGLSNSLLEAMACGCAVIGSSVGGTPELIDDGRHGLLFRVSDAADLSEKMAMLAVDVNLRIRLRGAAARFVREQRTMEICARRIAAIYEMVLRRNDAAHLLSHTIN
ncbi:MAG: glycosyltransferase [Acidobacteriaceae bacterium]|nr:glycosyltransferase [Acidobacteriaceae bacterium]